MSRKHQVVQGECIASIAHQYGLSARKLWEANSELKDRRLDLFVLREGDEVTIPAVEPKAISCASAKRHQFTRQGIPEAVVLRLVDEGDEPLSGLPYELTIKGHPLQTGTTTGDGHVEVEVWPDVKEGRLRVGSKEDQDEYTLQFGQLDPVGDVTGVQGRLDNLGFPVGPVDGDLGQVTRASIQGLADLLSSTLDADELDGVASALFDEHDSRERGT